MSDLEHEELNWDSPDSLFVRRQGRVDGPLKISKIQSEIKLKKLARYHEVSVDAKAWKRASELEWLFPKPKIRKPIRRKEVEKVNDEGQYHNAETGYSADTTQTEGHGNAQWYIAVDEEPDGPFTIEQVYQKASNGEVAQGDMIWKEDFDDWIEIQTLDEFKDIFDEESQTAMTRIVTAAQASAIGNARQNSIAGFASLACSILLCFPFPLMAIGLGIYSLYEITTKHKSGKPYAISGIVLGFLGMVVNFVGFLAYWFEWFG